MKRFIRYGIVAAALWSGVLSAGAQNLLPADVEAGCKLWVDSVFATLNAREKVAQLVVGVIPARADKHTKKQVRDWTRKQRIGALLFSEGTAEEQAILANEARKAARVPVLVLAGQQRLADRLSDVPRFPDDAALDCIADKELLDAYHRETGRELRVLGMQPDTLPASLGGLAVTVGMVTVEADVKDWIDRLADSLRTEVVEARCRRVLACKYLSGLRERQPELQVSGMSHRIGTDKARSLAQELRYEAVTVVNNYFGLLPFSADTGKTVALLSIGEEGADTTFTDSFRACVPADCYRLPAHASEAETEVMWQKLTTYDRIVVSFTGDAVYPYAGTEVVRFLSRMDGLKAALAYVFFHSYRAMLPLEEAVGKAGCVVLAHSAEADVQHRVADLFFGKAGANGRLPVNIGRTFPKGTGVDLRPGVKAGRTVPEDYGMKSYVLQDIDRVARLGVEKDAYPGCRILVLKDGHPVYDKGFGTHSDKDTTAVRSTDLFDLASLTKPMATTLAVMKLYEDGKLRLEDKASRFLPFLRGDKRNITVRELLLHESGLPPHIRFYVDAIDPNSVHGPYAQSWVDTWHRTQVSEHSYYCSDFRFKRGLMSDKPGGPYTLHVADSLWLNKSFKQTMMRRIAACSLGQKRYVYSDLGFILLQQIVEKVSGLPLHLYVAKEFYAPMGLQRTLFLPLDRFSKSDIMPTVADDYLRRQDLCGYVHDEAAAFLGGVSGNAGLFSTASEVGAVFQMLLNGGQWRGKRYLKESTCRLFLSETSELSRRGLGFDHPDAIALRSPCSLSAPPSVFGHTGFTGTCAWADPDNGLVYVFLSNRLCPHPWNTKLGDMDIRRDIQELVYQSLKEQVE